MSYELTVLRRAGYLHIRVTGQNSRETVRGYLADIYILCIEQDCPTLLIEEDLTGPRLKMHDIFSVISDASKRTWPHIRRIAYVDLQSAPPGTLMKFAETVAVNRGVNVRLFPSVEDAEDWLCS